jgi:hypothetical protein
MYKVIDFKTDGHSTKIECLNDLAYFLNKLGDVVICDLEKEWIELNGFYYLFAIVTYYDFADEI